MPCTHSLSARWQAVCVLPAVRDEPASSAAPAALETSAAPAAPTAPGAPSAPTAPAVQGSAVCVCCWSWRAPAVPAALMTREEVVTSRLPGRFLRPRRNPHTQQRAPSGRSLPPPSRQQCQGRVAQRGRQHHARAAQCPQRTRTSHSPRLVQHLAVADRATFGRPVLVPQSPSPLSNGSLGCGASLLCAVRSGGARCGASGSA